MPRLGLGSSLTGGSPPLADTSFISTWTVSGDEAARTVTLPLVSSGTTNFTIDWGDDTAEEAITAYNDADRIHIYAENGTYTVTMAGSIRGFKFDNAGDKTKIRTITQWGTFDISVNDAFYGCANLNVTATDAPIVSSTDLANVWRSCTALTSIGGLWDVSSVQVFSSMFTACTNFNQNIGSWNTQSATNMGSMFLQAASFNQDIGSWDMSNVTTTASMFYQATAFNGDISSWNVSSLESAVNMFRLAINFNANISSWNTSSVTTMNSMFHSAATFNQPIGGWVTAAVTDMNSMLRQCTAFNQDISSWNTAIVTDMDAMFRQCVDFNQDITTSGNSWNV